MGKGIPPTCQAMVLCDGLYQSPSTGRMNRVELIFAGEIVTDRRLFVLPPSG
jgi:hypothetical protein